MLAKSLLSLFAILPFAVASPLVKRQNTNETLPQPGVLYRPENQTTLYRGQGGYLPILYQPSDNTAYLNIDMVFGGDLTENGIAEDADGVTVVDRIHRSPEDAEEAISAFFAWPTFGDDGPDCDAQVAVRFMEYQVGAEGVVDNSTELIMSTTMVTLSCEDQPPAQAA